MSTVTAIQGVDEILYALSTTAVAALDPKPDVTVGPLDGDEDTLRLNWFLYRVSPDPAYRNMEPPNTGWRTARGNPPLALRLSYLLSAFPAAKTLGGDQEQFAHVGLAAVMQAVYENAIVGHGSPVLTPALATFVDPLIEPIRIVLEDLDLEAVTKIWTAASKPIRLSVGYGVSIILIEPIAQYVAGPPVKTRRIGLAPSLGPRLAAVTPSRLSFGDQFDVEVAGLTNGSAFTLAHDPADPAGPDWPLTVVPGAPTDHVTLTLPAATIAPGLRELDVSATENGLPFGRDSIAVTVVPVLASAPNPVPKNVSVSLGTAHAAPDVEAFLLGKRLDDVTFVSPTQVDVVIPPATPAGPADLVLRAGKVAGPVRSVSRGMTDGRLRLHLALLSTALESYLVQLRLRWNLPADDGTDAEIRRLLAGVGAAPAPVAGDAERAAELLSAPAEGPLPGISAALGLSAGEEALTAAAWWSEADPQLAIVLGCAHDDAARRYPSAALLHLLLEPYGIVCPVALDDDSPLVTAGVLEAGAGANGALRLTPTARLLLAGSLPHPLDPGQPLPARIEGTVAALARRLAAGAAGVVVLRGAHGVGRRAAAAAAAARAGCVPVGGDRSGAELRLLARTGAGLPVVDVTAVSELGWSEADGPLVAIGSPGESVAGGYVVELASPDFDERRALWSAGLDAEGFDDESFVDALATRFAFTDRDVAQTLARARTDASWHRRELELADVWEAARRQPEHALERVAALVPPAFTLDDLVLPAERMAQLRELVAHVELQHVVLDEWGFRRRMPRGRGVIALFAGPPGTGKTTAAEAIAHALRQDLYRVDLSAVVSKYIGETEKNLATAFDEAERASAVLFFDEADSLFGKRTEVKDAHDRYANLEVNYLLQRIETFTGLVLLATNRQSALDEAFARRLRFVIRFEHPDRKLRADLWRRSFPGETQTEGLEWEVLAGPELTGGSIQNAALAAAYLAAANGAIVQTSHVEHALRREHEKLGKSFAGLFQ